MIFSGLEFYSKPRPLTTDSLLLTTCSFATSWENVRFEEFSPLENLFII